ncbi:MAG: spore germination protein [Anaerovoracaceae bacterium]
MNSNLELTKSLDENIDMLKRLFHGDKTVKYRELVNRDNPGIKGVLVFIDGMCNSLVLNSHAIQPFLTAKGLKKDADLVDTLCKEILYYNEISKNRIIGPLLSNLLAGDALFFIDGYEQAIVISVKHWEIRGVQEPDGEKVISGPREGFNEAILTNLSLLRRKIRNPNLKYEFINLGRQTNTSVCLCYIKGIANPAILQELQSRLNRIDIDGVLDANYIHELIRDSAWSPFPTAGSTERPDVVAANLLEGRIAILIDGTPVSLTVPFFLIENFQTNDDYYSGFYFGSFSRILRILGFFVTISLPALYLAVVTFHQELLPTRFLLNLSESRLGLPFPTFLEMLILILAFELIREGGSRIPSGFGQTLSVVGGLVLGQASVDARLVSIPVVIIVAFTGITGLTIPQLKTPALLLRIIWLILASVLGIFGYLIGITGLLIHMASLKSFGIPYASSLSTTPSQKYRDIILRAPWNKMIMRPAFISCNRRRQVVPK